MGQRLEVVRARNTALVGLAGLVLDETPATFVVDTPKGPRRLLKGGTLLRVDGRLVSGQALLRRPEERLS